MAGEVPRTARDAGRLHRWKRGTAGKTGRGVWNFETLGSAHSGDLLRSFIVAPTGLSIAESAGERVAVAEAPTVPANGSGNELPIRERRGDSGLEEHHVGRKAQKRSEEQRMG